MAMVVKKTSIKIPVSFDVFTSQFSSDWKEMACPRNWKSVPADRIAGAGMG